MFIISGRDQAFLEQHLSHIDRLGMSAEHGGFFREPGQKTWTNLTEKLDMSWMSEVEEIFRYYTEVRMLFFGNCVDMIVAPFRPSFAFFFHWRPARRYLYASCGFLRTIRSPPRIPSDPASS